MSPSAHLSRRTAVLRSLVAAALVVLGLSAEGLHGLLQPHRFCAAHGALEHVEAEGAASHDHAGDLDPHGAPGYAVQDEGVPHERCAVVTFSRDEDVALAPPCAPVGLAPLPGVRLPRIAADDPRAPRVATYRLAPKQSPPA